MTFRGLHASRYKRAYRAGANASSKRIDKDQIAGKDPIDYYWDKYCAGHGITYRHPLANAWMDGWVNFDTQVEQFMDENPDGQ